MMQAAYTYYFRGNVPDGSDGSALSGWLATELNTIQRAIPFRTTKTVTAAYTLTAADDIVLVDATSAGVTITFPDPTSVMHGTWTVKKIDSSGHAVTFASKIASTNTAATFDGVTSPTLVSQYDSRMMRSDGNAYYQVVGVTSIFTGSVPAANVTSGTFGSASGDVGTYTFSHAMTVTGLATVGSLAIGATGKGFDASGNLSAVAGVFAGAVTFGTDNAFDVGASGASRPRSIYVATSVAVGAIPATNGPIRVPGNGFSAIVARNAANTGNVDLIYLDGTDSAHLPNTVVAGTLQIGSTRSAGVAVQGGTITIKDSTGATVTLLTT